MTQREFFATITEGTVITAEQAQFATAAVEKLDAANAKKRERNAEKAKENLPLIEAIAAVLTDEPATAANIAKEINVSTAKAVRLLQVMNAEGKVGITEIKVKGRKVNGYTIAEQEKRGKAQRKLGFSFWKFFGKFNIEFFWKILFSLKFKPILISQFS